MAQALRQAPARTPDMKRLLVFPRLLAAAFLASFPFREARPALAGEPRVVVVGGGLAGLVAAYELQKKGIAAHVLEASERWGGRVATMEYGPGLRSEYGMHEIWDSNPLLSYAREFRLPLSEPEAAHSSVVLDGKLHPYVQESLVEYLKTLFNEEERGAYARWLKEVERLHDEASARGLTPELSEIQKLPFSRWVESFSLPARVAEFIRLGVECEAAADWGAVGALYGILQESIFLHGGEQCRRIVGGNHRLIAAFTAALEGPKTLGATVTRITRAKSERGGTEVLVEYMKGGALRRSRAEKVLVAVPYHTLHAIQFEPALSEAQWRAVDTLLPGRYTVVHFLMDAGARERLQVDGKSPFPVLTRGPLGVVYGFAEKSPAARKEEVFTLLIHGDYAQSYLEPRDKIRARLLTELDSLWPGFSGFVRGAHFYGYHPAATPGWGPGRSPLDGLHASLREENAGLFLAGDYLYSSHAEGAVQSGREAARKIAESLAKRPEPLAR